MTGRLKLLFAAFLALFPLRLVADSWQLIATNVDLGLYTNQSVRTVEIRFLPGTLAEHITSNLSSRITRRKHDRDLEMFSSGLTETTNLVRNPTFWLADLPEVTAFCAVRRYSLKFGPNANYYPNATLLTRRHVLQVKHNRSPTGSGVAYVSRDNRRLVRRVIDWQPVGNCDTNAFQWTNDCYIVQALNEPVPAEFTPLKLLPSEANRYIGDFAPILFGHQTKTFSILYVVDRPFLNLGFTNVFHPFGAERPEWFIPAVGGDSGTSAEYLIEGHLVLMNRNSDEIIQAIKVLNSRHGTKELPEQIDLARYPKLR